MRDLYVTLQVHPQADQDVIRAAYRVLARRLHPDVGGDPTRMSELATAWSILSRPDRRERYDRELACVVADGRAASTAAASATRAGSASQTARAAAGSAAPAGPASPDTRPASTAAGTIDRDRLDFGRYAGWTLAQIARHDPDYLLWLARTPTGRAWRRRIDDALASRPAPPARPPVAAASSRRWFGHR